MQAGGAERVASRLSCFLEKNHEVLFVVFCSKRQHYQHGGKLVDLNLSPEKQIVKRFKIFFLRVIFLTRFIKKEEPDLIISFLETANIPSIIASKFSGHEQKLKVSVRNNPLYLSWFHQICLKYLYRYALNVVAVSNGVKKALLNWGIADGNITSIPNPCPIITKEDVAQEETACANKIERPQRYILGVGRLHPQKGFDRLIKTFSRMTSDDLSLVIIGEGSEQEKLKVLTATLGLKNRVIFPGNVRDLSGWYRNAMCFVLSSHYEGWPNVMMEAMSYQCPVISFDCDYGPSEIITNYHDGILVRQNELEMMRIELENLVSDEQLRRRLSTNALHTLSKYKIEKISELWLAK